MSCQEQNNTTETLAGLINFSGMYPEQVIFSGLFR